MDLKKRLASLDRLSRKTTTALPTEPAGKRLPPEDIATGELGLQMVKTASGTCFLRDYTDALATPGAELPDFHGFFSDPGSEIISPGEILFLDTETTGLAGGTGTMAFLVGVSWWETDQFLTRQFFLCGPGGEAGLLRNLHELAASFKAVVTFNGASFDLPLLRTRALLNRLEHPWGDLLSWDLLVPSRRLWGRRLANCRQQTVESHLNLVGRDERDIPGHLIPQTWFDFLQQGHSEDLVRVLYHNRRDMLGMAHIFSATANMSQTLAGETEGGTTDWQAAWALGRIAERRGEVPLSLKWMDLAHSLAGQVGTPFADRRFVAEVLRVLKRGGNWSVVENLIARALASGQNEPWLHREAAILFEHRLVNLERARQHASACGDDHRLLRLQRKLEAQRLRKEKS